MASTIFSDQSWSLAALTALEMASDGDFAKQRVDTGTQWTRNSD